MISGYCVHMCVSLLQLMLCNYQPSGRAPGVHMLSGGPQPENDRSSMERVLRSY